jgi:hypothetical protein
MFDPAKNLNTRFTDAVDLFIDFATLGEYGLEFVGGPAASLDPVGRTRQGCADSPSVTRTTTRSAQCDLLEESGLTRPTSARVVELQDLRKYRDIRTAGAPRKQRRRAAGPSQIQITRASSPTQAKQLSFGLGSDEIRISRGSGLKQSRQRGVREASGTRSALGAA